MDHPYKGHITVKVQTNIMILHYYFTPFKFFNEQFEMNINLFRLYGL